MPLHCRRSKNEDDSEICGGSRGDWETMLHIPLSHYKANRVEGFTED